MATSVSSSVAFATSDPLAVLSKVVSGPSIQAMSTEMSAKISSFMHFSASSDSTYDGNDSSTSFGSKISSHLTTPISSSPDSLTTSDSYTISGFSAEVSASSNSLADSSVGNSDYSVQAMETGTSFEISKFMPASSSIDFYYDTSDGLVSTSSTETSEASKSTSATFASSILSETFTQAISTGIPTKAPEIVISLVSNDFSHGNAITTSSSFETLKQSSSTDSIKKSEFDTSNVFSASTPFTSNVENITSASHSIKSFESLFQATSTSNFALTASAATEALTFSNSKDFDNTLNVISSSKATSYEKSKTTTSTITLNSLSSSYNAKTTKHIHTLFQSTSKAINSQKLSVISKTQSLLSSRSQNFVDISKVHASESKSLVPSDNFSQFDSHLTNLMTSRFSSAIISSNSKETITVSRSKETAIVTHKDSAAFETKKTSSISTFSAQMDTTIGSSSPTASVSSSNVFQSLPLSSVASISSFAFTTATVSSTNMNSFSSNIIEPSSIVVAPSFVAALSSPSSIFTLHSISSVDPFFVIDSSSHDFISSKNAATSSLTGPVPSSIVTASQSAIISNNQALTVFSEDVVSLSVATEPFSVVTSSVLVTIPTSEIIVSSFYETNYLSDIASSSSNIKHDFSNKDTSQIILSSTDGLHSSDVIPKVSDKIISLTVSLSIQTSVVSSTVAIAEPSLVSSFLPFISGSSEESTNVVKPSEVSSVIMSQSSAFDSTSKIKSPTSTVDLPTSMKDSLESTISKSSTSFAMVSSTDVAILSSIVEQTTDELHLSSVAEPSENFSSLTVVSLFTAAPSSITISSDASSISSGSEISIEHPTSEVFQTDTTYTISENVSSVGASSIVTIFSDLSSTFVMTVPSSTEPDLVSFFTGVTSPSSSNSATLSYIKSSTTKIESTTSVPVITFSQNFESSILTTAAIEPSGILTISSEPSWIRATETLSMISHSSVLTDFGTIATHAIETDTVSKSSTETSGLVFSSDSSAKKVSYSSVSIKVTSGTNSSKASEITSFESLSFSTAISSSPFELSHATATRYIESSSVFYIQTTGFAKTSSELANITESFSSVGSSEASRLSLSESTNANVTSFSMTSPTFFASSGSLLDSYSSSETAILSSSANVFVSSVDDQNIPLVSGFFVSELARFSSHSTSITVETSTPSVSGEFNPILVEPSRSTSLFIPFTPTTTYIESLSVPIITSTTDNWLPDNLIVQTYSSDVNSEDFATTTASGRGVLASSLPKVISPFGNEDNKPSGDFSFIQIGFQHQLNYPFVASHPLSAAQIFKYLPLGLAYGLNLNDSDVSMQSIKPYELDTAGYVISIAMIYIPNSSVSLLESLLLISTSRLYQNPNSSIKDLMSLIDPSIPLISANRGSLSNNGQNNGLYGPSDSSGLNSDQGLSNFEETKSGRPNSGSLDQPTTSNTTVHSKTIGIAVGAVFGSAAYCGAIFLLSKHYRQRKKSVELEGRSSPVMAVPRPQRSPLGSRPPISVPVCSENSLGWS